MTINNLVETFKILSVDIHYLNLRDLTFFLKNNLLNENSPQLITTFNLDFLRITTIDNVFLNICNNSLLNLPDGYGIIKIVKKKYNKSIIRITGNDIFTLLIELSKKYNKKIAIIGGTNNVSKKTEQLLINQYKFQPINLLCISPKYKFDENIDLNEKIVKKIATFQPDIVFAALGCPRQEKWLYKNMNIFESKLNIGIGATLDFFTKEKKRSPVFLQSIGLEWLWRLINEPKRLFKRYIIHDLPFFIKIYFSKKL